MGVGAGGGGGGRVVLPHQNFSSTIMDNHGHISI